MPILKFNVEILKACDNEPFILNLWVESQGLICCEGESKKEQESTKVQTGYRKPFLFDQFKNIFLSVEYSTMLELPLLGPEIRVQILVRTDILSNSNRLYRLCYTDHTSKHL